MRTRASQPHMCRTNEQQIQHGFYSSNKCSGKLYGTEEEKSLMPIIIYIQQGEKSDSGPQFVSTAVPRIQSLNWFIQMMKTSR